MSSVHRSMYAAKHGRSSGGLSLRGSGDFFAGVDTALSLRRRQQLLVLTVEPRAAAAPDPVTLALVGPEDEMHLALMPADARSDPTAASTGGDLDATILHALEEAGPTGLSRSVLRAAVHVRNERVGEALRPLAAAGEITRHGDTWARVPPRPTPCIHRNRNGNAPDPDP